jgi:hypothetical protein
MTGVGRAVGGGSEGGALPQAVTSMVAITTPAPSRAA